MRYLSIVLLLTVSTFASAEERIGRVRKSHLQSPISLQDRFGTSALAVTSKRKPAVEPLMRQGLLYYHAFHWTKAARAFNQVLRLEDNAMASAFLALSYLQIEGFSGPLTYSRAAAEAALNFRQNLTAEESQFVRFAYTYVCIFTTDQCGLAELNGKTADQVASDALATGRFYQADYLAVMGWLAHSDQVLQKAIEQDSINPGAYHYLTHVYESFGDVTKALPYAKYYAEQVIDSAHAQHMYGHILPQVGRWEDAAKQFRIAHEIHLQEFANDGIQPQEEWHYGHNLSLYSSTMTYLKRTAEALQVAEPPCDESGELQMCIVPMKLKATLGRFADVVKMSERFLGSWPDFLNLQLLAALGLGDRNLAESFFTKLQQTGGLQSPQSLSSQFAYAALNNQATSELESLFTEFQEAMKHPGFDSWSVNVMQVAMLERVLREKGLTSWADRVAAVPIGPARGHQH